MKKLRIAFVLIGLFLLAGCGNKTEREKDAENFYVDNPPLVQGLGEAEHLETEYARCFCIDRYADGSFVLTLPKSVQLLILPENGEVPEGLSEGIIPLKAPVDHIYLVASAAASMVDAIGAVDAISYCGLEAEGWYVPGMKEAVENGSVKYAGKYRMPDYELLTADGCRLAIENTMIAHVPEIKEKLEEIGIPVIIDYSSYEPSPLGRIEWVKFYGALTGHYEEACAAFDEQKKKAVGLSETGKTVAFFYLREDGAAVVRRSDDYVPQMIEMAGGTYLPSKNSGESYLSTAPMQIEAFYRVARDADYLVYNAATTDPVDSVEALTEKCELLKDFKAVREGHVYLASQNLYQQSMSLGSVVADFHAMMEDAPDSELTVLKHLE